MQSRESGSWGCTSEQCLDQVSSSWVHPSEVKAEISFLNSDVAPVQCKNELCFMLLLLQALHFDIVCIDFCGVCVEVFLCLLLTVAASVKNNFLVDSELLSSAHLDI